MPEESFRETERAFEEAVGNVGGTTEFYMDLAGARIRIQCAGERPLRRLAATLAHLECERDGKADLTIHMWDAAQTGVAPAMANERIMERTFYGCTQLLTNERYRTFHLPWTEIYCCVDLQEKEAFCCYGDGERLLMYEVSGPLRSVFGLILNQRGMQLVHAAAIGTDAGSLLFAGPPGSGKSTLATLCLRAGLRYQSDDLCVLSAEKQPRSFSIYNIAKLREDAIPRFPEFHPLLAHFEEDEEKKAYFYVHEHFPEQVLREARVRALVLPSVGNGAASRLEPAVPMEAVRGVISWTVKEIPKSDTAGEKIMLQAIARLPAYRLHLGRDEGSTLEIIRSLLQ